MKTKTAKSDNKLKFSLAVVIILIVILFAVNWIVGNIMENKLAQNIEKSLKELEQPINFSYQQLDVNPIFAQASFKNGKLQLENSRNPINIQWDQAVYKSSYADLLNLMSEENFRIDKIHALKTNFDNLKISGAVQEAEYFDYLFTFSELKLDFNGKLSRQELKEKPSQILAHNQNLELSFKDFELDFPSLFDKILINSNLQEKLLNLDEVNLNVDYTADNKNIKIKEVVNSSYSSGKLTGNIKLLGTNVKEITGMRLDLESTGQFDAKNLKWGLSDQTGKYTIDKLYGKSEFELEREVNFDNYVKGESIMLGESDYDFNLEGLKMQFAGRLKEKLSANPLVMMSGININEIMVNNFNMSYQTNNQEMKIEKAKLDSSLVDAEGAADLELNNQYPDLSKINTLELKLSDFKGNLRKIFEGLEKRMGISLPREGDAVVLEVKGTFANPRVKGVHY